MACWGPEGGREGKIVNNVIIGEFPEGLLMLLEKNPDFSITDRDGNNAIHISCSTNAIKCVKIWAEKKGDFNILNLYGENALTIATRYGVYDVVVYLCENVPVNYKQLNTKGKNILDVANLCPNQKVYSYLIEFLSKNGEHDLIAQHFFNNSDKKNGFDLVMRFCVNFELLAQALSRFINSSNFNEFAEQYGKTDHPQMQEVLFNLYSISDKEKFLIDTINTKNNKILQDLFKINPEHIKKYLKTNTKKILQSLKIEVFRTPSVLNCLLDNFELGEVLKFRNDQQQNIFMILFDLAGHNTNSIYHIGRLLEEQKLLDKAEMGILLDERDAFSLNLFDYGLKSKNVLPFKYLNQLSGREDKFEFKTVKIKIEKQTQITEENLFNLRKMRQTPTKIDDLQKIMASPKFDVFFEIFNSKNAHMTFNVNYLDFGITVKYINNEIDWKECLHDLLGQSLISLDMETANTITKTEILSLIQIATMERIYVIDAVQLFQELRKSLPLLFENPKILKLIFSCMSDIKILYFYLQVRLVNILDICIAYNIFKTLKQGAGLKTVVEDV